MFEKDEDYRKARKESRDSITKVIKVWSAREVALHNEGFKDGAEFGYNKANEWHYVKDELPPEKVPLNIITFDKNKKRSVWVGEYNGGNGQWWTGYFNHFIDVPYAWKEIVLPKEKE